MSKQTVWITIGNIGSGKSTWSWMKASSNSLVSVVSQDSIREMIHGGEYVFDEQLEQLVSKIAWKSIFEILNYKRHLVIDECNLSTVKRCELIKKIRDCFPNVHIVGVVFPLLSIFTNAHIARRIKEPKIVASEERIKYTWNRVHAQLGNSFNFPVIDDGFDELIDDYGVQFPGEQYENAI